ncbi:Antibiotic biosynthesis monooxygenase [Klebsiella aerogenes]|nr:Antibiotic biosynthesis monooxygenase [Klebsiella aerogenes]
MLCQIIYGEWQEKTGHFPEARNSSWRSKNRLTLVISHLLDPQHSQRYEEWLGKIMPIAAEFPGHLGANVIRPAAGQNLWSVIIRFDTLEHLYALDAVGNPSATGGLRLPHC